jgi:nucleoid-associated protein YgaU
MYTVLKGDYLWKIAKKPEIYGDPYQWIRIYCQNKDQIKNEDLIYPNQNFKITRMVADNEYLVVKGDNLKKIAGLPNVLNDPAQWTKLYETNKDLIRSDKMLFPNQVLIIPKE